MYATDIQAQWAKSTWPPQQVSLKGKQEPDCSEKLSLFSSVESKLSLISSYKIMARAYCLFSTFYRSSAVFNSVSNFRAWMQETDHKLFHPLPLVNTTYSIKVHMMLFSSHWTALCWVKDLMKYIINLLVRHKQQAKGFFVSHTIAFLEDKWTISF